MCSSTHVSNDVGILGNGARKEQEPDPGEHRQGWAERLVTWFKSAGPLGADFRIWSHIEDCPALATDIKARHVRESLMSGDLRGASSGEWVMAVVVQCGVDTAETWYRASLQKGHPE